VQFGRARGVAPRMAAAAVVAVAATVLAPLPALGQGRPAQSSAAVPPSDVPQAPPPPARGNPGLIEEIGKLFEDSRARWPALPALKPPGEVLEDLNIRAKEAGDGLSRLGKSNVVKGRRKCPVSANGAPNCQIAADEMCRENGFREGKSVDHEANNVCSPKAILAGRGSEPGACRTETFVTGALCQ